MNIFGSKFKIIVHICAGLFLGGVIALVYLSSSQTFRQFVEQKIEEQFERDYHANMRARLESIDWLSCKMTFCNVSITPHGLLSQKNYRSMVLGCHFFGMVN